MERKSPQWWLFLPLISCLLVLFAVPPPVQFPLCCSGKLTSMNYITQTTYWFATLCFTISSSSFNTDHTSVNSPLVKLSSVKHFWMHCFSAKILTATLGQQWHVLFLCTSTHSIPKPKRQFPSFPLIWSIPSFQVYLVLQEVSKYCITYREVML